MKKVLALVLAGVMALSLTTVASALDINDTQKSPDYTDAGGIEDEGKFVFDGDTFEDELIPVNDGDGDSDDFVTVGDSLFATKVVDGNTTTEYDFSATVSSSNSDMIKASLTQKTRESGDDEGKYVVLKLDPADAYFTVEEHEVKIKLVVIQKEKASNGHVAKYSKEFKVKIKNEEHGEDDFFENSSGKIVSAVGDLSKPVIAEDVFTGIADGEALELNYGDYSVNFAKVNNQNTGLYLKADTAVADGSKAIASIAFKSTRVKDTATISMPIDADDENLYGEKVYVYALVDGKPSGEAIPGDVINHNSVIFTVPAGTTLGTYAAYGDKATGDAEKPAIPETGANDIVNIAIVFAVVALAAAGFVAVKKASK